MWLVSLEMSPKAERRKLSKEKKAFMNLTYANQRAWRKLLGARNLPNTNMLGMDMFLRFDTPTCWWKRVL